jgi:hypothetical protein
MITGLRRSSGSGENIVRYILASWLIAAATLYAPQEKRCRGHRPAFGVLEATSFIKDPSTCHNLAARQMLAVADRD